MRIGIVLQSLPIFVPSVSAHRVARLEGTFLLLLKFLFVAHTNGFTRNPTHHTPFLFPLFTTHSALRSRALQMV